MISDHLSLLSSIFCQSYQTQGKNFRSICLCVIQRIFRKCPTFLMLYNRTYTLIYIWIWSSIIYNKMYKQNFKCKFRIQLLMTNYLPHYKFYFYQYTKFPINRYQITILPIPVILCKSNHSFIILITCANFLTAISNQFPDFSMPKFFKYHIINYSLINNNKLC